MIRERFSVQVRAAGWFYECGAVVQRLARLSVEEKIAGSSPASLAQMLERTCSRSSADRTRFCEDRGHRFKSYREHFLALEGECAGVRSLSRKQVGGQPLGFETSAFRGSDNKWRVNPGGRGLAWKAKRRRKALGSDSSALRSDVTTRCRSSEDRASAFEAERREFDSLRQLFGTQLAPVAQRRRHLSYKEAHHDAGSSPAGSIGSMIKGRQAPGGSGGLFAKECAPSGVRFDSCAFRRRKDYDQDRPISCGRSRPSRESQPPMPLASESAPESLTRGGRVSSTRAARTGNSSTNRPRPPRPVSRAGLRQAEGE